MLAAGILTIVIVALLVDRYLSSKANQAQEAKIIAFAEEVVKVSRDQVSEMATRIQHPEVMRPELTAVADEPSPPVYDDELHLVGQIIPESNGHPDEAA